MQNDRWGTGLNLLLRMWFYHYCYYPTYIKVHTATIIIITIIIIIIILIVCIMAYEVILLWPWDAVIALPFSIYQTKIINFSFKCKRSKEHKHTVTKQMRWTTNKLFREICHILLPRQPMLTKLDQIVNGMSK